MRQPVALDRIAQSLDHRILTDQFGKALRPVFPREHAVRLRLHGLDGFTKVKTGFGHGAYLGRLIPIVEGGK
jgi:hypothetical protein